MRNYLINTFTKIFLEQFLKKCCIHKVPCKKVLEEFTKIRSKEAPKDQEKINSTLSKVRKLFRKNPDILGSYEAVKKEAEIEMDAETFFKKKATENNQTKEF